MSAAVFPESRVPVVNVATVPQRSPLRYPGGKTWLVPHIREWLAPGAPHPLLVEPFAGGAIVALTALAGDFAERATLVERDPDVAAFWRAVLTSGPTLAARVRAFQPDRRAVERLAASVPADNLERGFRTLVLNRTRWGGVLAPGAAPIRAGEAGAGLASRWYGETLARRIEAIAAMANRIDLREGDGLRLLEDTAAQHQDARFFIDPPYTAPTGKRAGSRLYPHSQIDHAALFSILAEHGSNFLMTYDAAPEIAELVGRHGFAAVRLSMKNTHHNRLSELVITPEPLFS